jgi:membrane protein
MSSREQPFAKQERSVGLRTNRKVTRKIGRDVGEPDRGREAETPSGIPPSGWKDIFLRVYQNVGKDRVIALAAGITFYSLLAIFPAIAALVAIYGLFADPATISSHLDSAAGLLPGGAIDVIRDQMTRIASHGKSTLGLTFFIGLGVSLWSANAGMKSIFDALNLVYNEEEKRGFVTLNLVSLTFTALAVIFVLVAISAVVSLRCSACRPDVGAGSARLLIRSCYRLRRDRFKAARRQRRSSGPCLP